MTELEILSYSTYEQIGDCTVAQFSIYHGMFQFVAEGGRGDVTEAKACRWKDYLIRIK